MLIKLGIPGKYAFPDIALAHSDEHRMTTQDPENVVRIFVLKDTPTVQDLQRKSAEIRRTTLTRRAFMYNNHRALVMRGTAEQIAHATQLTEH